jgi:hypothetical protein
MSSPIILIPRQFKGVTVSKLANDITSQHPNELPGALTFDFCQSALDWDPSYCLIYECYPDGALAAVDPISTDRP